MKTLANALGAAFAAPQRPPTRAAAAARRARALGRRLGVGIDASDSRPRDPAFWLQVPTALILRLGEDPIAGQHFCTSWEEVLEKLEIYSAALNPPQSFRAELLQRDARRLEERLSAAREALRECADELEKDPSAAAIVYRARRALLP